MDIVKLRNSIFNDDCFNIFPLIPDNSIDMILADLPYGQTKNVVDKQLDLVELWKQYKRIIKTNGAIVLYGQGKFVFELYASNPSWFRYEWIWKKGERVTGFLNSKKRPLINHERIMYFNESENHVEEHEQLMVFYNSQCTYNPQMSKGASNHSIGQSHANKNARNNVNYGNFIRQDSRIGEDMKYPKSVLNFERPHPPIHPTQKSVDLNEFLIRTYTNEGEIVLDNTAGIGTTGMAAKKSNRFFICIEKHKPYFEIMKEKLKD